MTKHAGPLQAGTYSLPPPGPPTPHSAAVAHAEPTAQRPQASRQVSPQCLTSGPGETLLRVEAAGLCHSDLHVWEGSFGKFVSEGKPLSLSHEIAGAAHQRARAGRVGVHARTLLATLLSRALRSSGRDRCGGGHWRGSVEVQAR